MNPPNGTPIKPKQTVSKGQLNYLVGQYQYLLKNQARVCRRVFAKKQLIHSSKLMTCTQKSKHWHSSANSASSCLAELIKNNKYNCHRTVLISVSSSLESFSSDTRPDAADTNICHLHITDCRVLELPNPILTVE